MVKLGIDGISEATEIGAGGSASVYRATQVALGREVAVKILHVHFGVGDDTERRRFRREQMTLGKLSDLRGIVPLYESGFTATGRPYLIMPYYAGGSLQQRLDSDGAVEWPTATAVMVSAARAVARAHAAGVLHRDIKPANIMIDRDGEPVVGDFGVARLVGSTTLFQSRALSTTPAYAPPEVFMGEEPTVAVDVYGLGASLFALLNGSPAFVSLTGDLNVLALMRRVETQRVPDLSSLGVPSEVTAAVERAMAKSPAERHEGADIFADELESALAAGGGLRTPLIDPPPPPTPVDTGDDNGDDDSSPPPPPTPVDADDDNGDDDSSPPPPPTPVDADDDHGSDDHSDPPPPSRRRRMIVGIAAGAVVLVLVIVAALQRDSGGEDDVADEVEKAETEEEDTSEPSAAEGTTSESAEAAASGSSEPTAADDVVDLGATFTLSGTSPDDAIDRAVVGFVDVYNSATGSSITYAERGSDMALLDQAAAGNAPDAAMIGDQRLVCELADTGALVSVEDMGFDPTQLANEHSPFWMDRLRCSDGAHYGIPWFSVTKSLVYYHAPTFEAKGYEIPATYADMVALTDQIIADGATPWCFGFGSNGATGWPGTDWIEELVLRTEGVDVYGRWIDHDIAFDDETVTGAFDAFADVFFRDGAVLGGADNAALTNFAEAPGPMFEDPPGCLMHKQGSFIENFFESGIMPAFEPGEEFEIASFPFPSVQDGPAQIVFGRSLVVFRDEPTTVRAITDWISSEWQCTLASPSGGGVAVHGGHGEEGIELLPASLRADPNCYDTADGHARAADVIDAIAAGTLALDASDLMPAPVGTGAFWSAMIDWAGGASAAEVTAAVEAVWPD